MSFLVSLTQKISPLECCRQPLNTKKELNLYQSQLQEPLKVQNYQKPKQLQKVVHVNHFYESSKHQSNFKVVEKSHYDHFLDQCQKNHQMFSDQEFEANEELIKCLGQEKKIVWRRLSQIYNKSQFSILRSQVFSHMSIKQQAPQMQFTPLKSSPFMSVLSMIKEKPDLIQQIFRSSQQMINNFGIYRLIINDHGYPKEIVIDDYVPVYINTNQLVLSHAYLNQLWPVVLEKAIAKVVGSYEKLQSIPAYEILRLITPAPTVKYELRTNEASETFLKHFSAMKNALQNGYLICTTSRTGLQNKKIKPSHTYTIIEIENSSNLDPLIVFFDPLYEQDGLTENESGMSLKSDLSKSQSYKQIFKLKYNSFAKYFQEFSVCYFQENFNMDFQRMQMNNRKPHFISLQVQQPSEIILTFSKVKRKFKTLSFINLSTVANQFKNITGVKGGWLKILVAKKTQNHTESSLEFVMSQIETEDNTLSIHFERLKAGEYVIYLEGYSEENESEFYSFTGYGSKPFFMKMQKQMSTRLEYFLEQVMLNHCLSSQKEGTVSNNYFIEYDYESWYVSNLLYKEGGLGYLVVYVSKDCKFSAEITIELEKIREEGYKLECKKVNKVYKKIIEPGSADVIVLSINYESKKDFHRVQFPPKSVQIQIFQKSKSELK